MTFTRELKKKAVDVGFVSVGVSDPGSLQGLPHGKVHSLYALYSPEEQLPRVRSVVLLALYVWDTAFNLQVDSAYLKDDGVRSKLGHEESYQLYYEVLKNKAWMVVDYLAKKGFESVYSRHSSENVCGQVWSWLSGQEYVVDNAELWAESKAYLRAYVGGVGRGRAVQGQHLR